MKRASQAGLTLIEIIIVISILSLLMTFLGKNLLNTAESTKAGINEMQMKRVQSYINQYQLRYNLLPASLKDLVECNEQTGQACIPVAGEDEKDFADPWGTPYRYSSDGRSYSLKSLGSDRADGGTKAASDVTLTGP